MKNWELDIIFEFVKKFIFRIIEKIDIFVIFFFNFWMFVVKLFFVWNVENFVRICGKFCVVLMIKIGYIMMLFMLVIVKIIWFINLFEKLLLVINLVMILIIIVSVIVIIRILKRIFVNIDLVYWKFLK